MPWYDAFAMVEKHLEIHPAKVLVSLQMVTDTADVDMIQPENLSNDRYGFQVFQMCRDTPVGIFSERS